MNFRLSHKLAEKIKVSSLKKLEVDENPLADWSAHVFVAERIQYVICCHTLSLYSCIFFGRGVTHGASFIKSALSAIRETMEEDGLEDVYLEKIVPSTRKIFFGRAFNRSVTGSMVEQMNHAKALFEDQARSLFDVGQILNENLLSALDYQHPRDVFLELCNKDEKNPEMK